ncbi:Zinc finger protein [Paragonimus skrjabini miyazakii]|uniref:Zinc finger protein n=1 Tax=Paragonimus skrjabini miyazakii TaxID=59628 RepID=A0A8S9YZ65_9TREM|nr:Zinc finger protein [Paragonimus skrjabini miyazakii]
MHRKERANWSTDPLLHVCTHIHWRVVHTSRCTNLARCRVPSGLFDNYAQEHVNASDPTIPLYCRVVPVVPNLSSMTSLTKSESQDPINGNLCESIQSSILSISKTANREPTAEEERLSRVLLERVLPPFTKSIKIQALVVYQADQGKMKCLLVNRKFDKNLPSHLTSSHTSDEYISGGLEPNDHLSDSGFVENAISSSLIDNSSKRSELDEIVDQSETCQLGSCRKRKLYRPCKIPQNGAFESESNVSPIPNNKSPSPPNPSFTPSCFSHSTAITCTTADVVPLNHNAVSDAVLLPVSAVTLMPRLSVFSLPVTVLSALPRPILPRMGLDKPITTATVFSVPVTTQIFQSAPTQPTVEDVKSTTHASSVESAENNFNRRFGKSFVCNQCHKDFASLNLLCAHTFSVHRGFRCTICRAQFTQRSNLQRHSLRHVGFKPFVCKVCDKAYYRKDHLVRHIEVSHPGRDPRVSLTVKLTSAECLDYLEKLQQNTTEAKQAQLLHQAPPVSESVNPEFSYGVDSNPESLTHNFPPSVEPTSISES